MFLYLKNIKSGQPNTHLVSKMTNQQSKDNNYAILINKSNKTRLFDQQTLSFLIISINKVSEIVQLFITEHDASWSDIVNTTRVGHN